MPTLTQARAWYPHADPVHGFDHVQRVYQMATRIAETEGANLEIVQSAALLHDVQGGETEGGEVGRSNPHLGSVAFAKLILAKEGCPAGGKNSTNDPQIRMIPTLQAAC